MITITTPTATIRPSTVERLLGAQVHQDMRWKDHLMDNDDSHKTKTKGNFYFQTQISIIVIVQVKQVRRTL
jgi:hypothetical protein